MLQFFIFEIKYRLRHISTYVFTFILSALMYLVVSFTGGMIDGITINIFASGDKVALNSPVVLFTMCSSMGVLAIFFLASFINQMFAKDFETRFYNILFTKPIKKSHYIIGNLCGNMVVMVCMFIVMLIVYAITCYMPYIDKEMITKSSLIWYIQPLLLSVIPNFYLIGALFIGFVCITKRTNYIFGVAFLLLILSSIASYFASKIDNQLLSTLIDPFGERAVALVHKGWTAAEMNTSMIHLTKFIIINRLFWICISTLILIFSINRFNFIFTFKDKKKSETIETKQTSKIFSIEPPAVAYKDTILLQFQQFVSYLQFNLKYIFKHPLVYVIAALGIGFILTTFFQANQIFGTSVFPVTYNMVDVIVYSFMIFMLIIMTFFSGELIWLSRENKFDLIEAALPYKNIVSYLSKYFAVVILMIAYFLMLMVTAICFQALKGYTNFEIGLYLKLIFLFHFPGLLLYLLLTFIIHNFVNHKYGSHFAFVLLFIILDILPALKIEHGLLRPMYSPNIRYSDMAGFGPNVESMIWFSTYWFLILLLFTGATVLCWKRGININYLKNYFKTLKTKPVLVYNGVFVILTLATAFYIFYNTNIKNTFVTTKKQERMMVNYEKKFKHFEKKSQPKVQDIKLNVDIYPEKESMYAYGTLLLKNTHDTQIDTLFIHYRSEELVLIDFPSTIVYTDKDFGIQIHKLNNPMTPGMTLPFNFKVEYLPNGFSNSGNSSTIFKNGTFINNHLFPTFGYSSFYEISRERRRKKLGLPEKDLLPATDDPWGLKFNYVSRDGDWVSFEAIVSTSEDQIALAPGKLVNSWTENKRNYYHYKTETDMINFYTFLSARYEVKRDTWYSVHGTDVSENQNGFYHHPVDLEIYYHPVHTYNIDSMMNSLKESLNHYTKVYGPYEHSVLRIAEFPRYAYFAQAFATLIPFSEGVGFIADVKKDKKIDYPFYITAHEAGHQWWAHQVIGGAVRGTVMLAESFTEYSAMQVVKRNFSDKLYRDQLKYTMDMYLGGRSGDSKDELPLTQVEHQQYVVYQKGLLTMNALSRLLGEDLVNTVLRNFLIETKYQANPYTNTIAFMNVLDPYVPDSLKTTVDDMFNKVVIYQHKIDKVDVNFLEDDSIQIILEFTAEKRYYDEGKPEIMEYEGWLEVGFVDRLDNILSLEKVWVTQKSNIVEFTMEHMPDKVVLDPYFVTLDLTPYSKTEKIK